MATIISTDRTTQVGLNSDAVWILKENVHLTPSDPLAAMHGTSIMNAFVQIYGHIVAGVVGSDFPTAILIDGADSQVNSVYVGSSGNIFAAGNGIEVHGTGNSIVNDGTIDAWAGGGVVFIGDTNVAVNRGSITGYNLGVYLEGSGNVLTNYGDIGVSAIGGFGSTIAIDIVSTEGMVNYVQNFGSISSFDIAILGLAGSDIVQNAGEIVGGISLGLGNDSVDNSAGTIRGFVQLEEGNDTYIGGDNESTTNVAGGDGDDTYFLHGGMSEIIEEVDGGSADRIFIDVSAALAANIEILTLVGGDDINGAGNKLDNFLFGNGGDNRLRGHGGSDVLLGGYGEDRLNGGAGLDYASYQFSEEAVSINLGKKTASGGDADGDTFLSIENLVGSAFGDTLTGDTGANRIQGFTGNDTIDGGAGNDSMEGGDGNDKFIFAKKSGHDTIEDFTLSGINSDRIDIQSFKPKSFADLQGHMTDDGSGNVDITYGKDVLTIENVTKAQLTTDHFVL